ncbi:MAG TPA: hypothetical protein VJQ49_13270 [Casimicrobiaceae bacterium]|nr:hypothetical protein [Casimicrobiaceae bacterium]
MIRSILGAALLAVVFAPAASAQPSDAADQHERSVNPYVYMMDSGGNKVLLSTQFWRNDPKYDDRAFHRFLDVMAALEKRGFHKNAKAAIENWDKPQPFARCYIYLEDLQDARKVKGALESGSRVYCTDNGASEHAIRQSDSPKHVADVLKYFDEYLARAKTKVKERGASG